MTLDVVTLLWDTITQWTVGIPAVIVAGSIVTWVAASPQTPAPVQRPLPTYATPSTDPVSEIYRALLRGRVSEPVLFALRRLNWAVVARCGVEAWSLPRSRRAARKLPVEDPVGLRKLVDDLSMVYSRALELEAPPRFPWLSQMVRPARWRSLERRANAAMDELMRRLPALEARA